MSGGGEDGGLFAGDKAAEPATTVLVCVSIFVKKTLDILKMTSGQIPAMFKVTKTESRAICSPAHGDDTGNLGAAPALFVATKARILNKSIMFS